MNDERTPITREALEALHFEVDERREYTECRLDDDHSRYLEVQFWPDGYVAVYADSSHAANAATMEDIHELIRLFLRFYEPRV